MEKYREEHSYTYFQAGKYMGSIEFYLIIFQNHLGNAFRDQTVYFCNS